MLYRKILVIDDNPVDLLICRKIIESAALAGEIVGQDSGSSALDYLAATPVDERPEVIFLDLNMPVLDGFGFLKALENSPQLLPNGCQIYILSSSDNPQDRSRAVQSRYVKNYLTKPLSREILNSLTHSRPGSAPAIS